MKAPLALSILLLFAFPATAQAPKYEPTKEESLEIKLSLRDAQIAQMQLQEAQRAFQEKSGEFSAEIEKVRAAHKWPSTVQYNMSTNAFEPAPSARAEPKRP